MIWFMPILPLELALAGRIADAAPDRVAADP